MIVRQWTGSVLSELAAEYLRLMEEVAIPDYRESPGNLAAWCLHSTRGAVTDVSMVTFWRDRQCIAAFAGADIDKARYYDFDDRFLLWKEERVAHREVSAGECAPDFGQGKPGGVAAEARP